MRILGRNGISIQSIFWCRVWSLKRVLQLRVEEARLASFVADLINVLASLISRAIFGFGQTNAGTDAAMPFDAVLGTFDASVECRPSGKSPNKLSFP